MQYYRGEQIQLVIEGNDAYNLSELNFGVVIYPISDKTAALHVTKSQMTSAGEGSNAYIASFSATDTKTLPLGLYAVEMYDDTNDLIYQQQGAFNLNDSVSKGLIVPNT